MPIVASGAESFGKSLGYPVYIPAAQIARMEIVRPLNGVKEATNA